MQLTLFQGSWSQGVCAKAVEIMPVG